MNNLTVVIKDARLFGKLDLVGSHSKPEDAQDIRNAIEDCFSKGFKTLYIYSSVADPSVLIPWFDANFDVTVDCDKTIYIYGEES